MSDLRIMEFRERAERGVAVPDLAVIERQGRALRRRRVAAATGGLALVLVAGIGIAGIATDGGDAAPGPANSPTSPRSTSWDDGVRTTVDRGEAVLLPGPSEVIYDGVAVQFYVPGRNWEWWEGGMGLRRTADQLDEYGAAVFILPEAVARLRPCTDSRAQQLGVDPDDLVANVAPLLDLAHATVLQGPRVVTAFGGDAVHLRLQTNGVCPEGGDRPAQLRGAFTGHDVDPGWPGQRMLDLWHVVVPGPGPVSVLVASWDLDGTAEHQAETQALLDSVRIDAG